MADFQVLERLGSIPRGRDEELRLELVEATSDRGNVSQFVSLRVWFKGDRGDMLPSKAGLTIRAGELKQVGLALKEAFVRIGCADEEQPEPRRQSEHRTRHVAAQHTEPGEDLSAGGAL